MIQYGEIELINDQIYFYTKGLTPFINKEIRLHIGDSDKDDYQNALKYIIDYIINDKPSISNDQTIAYYSWLLQFRSIDQKYFDLYEVISNGEGFIKGCDIAISIIRSQSEICAKHNLIPIFPTFSQNIVISKGVYEGMDIEAIRYESPTHMCGWWLITDDYDDDPKSLMNVHYYDVAFTRPDILKYLALPFGYRFFMKNDKVEIFIDE
ncbi:immunity protein Imm33 domain-containing protein [Chryseobacterium nematophagum]|nr:hypothetical protein [Chryseobacterium nematophagum]